MSAKTPAAYLMRRVSGSIDAVMKVASKRIKPVVVGRAKLIEPPADSFP